MSAVPPPPLRRDDLARADLVHAPDPKKPRLWLVARAGRRFAVKDIAHLSGWRKRIWRWWLRREARIYDELDGIEGIPRSYGLLDPDALVLGYLEGEVVRRESIAQQGEDFFERLHRLVTEVHARGFVHLDLGHRRNILVLEDGTPAVVDFAGALRIARLPLVGRLARWVDRHCVDKLAARYRKATGHVPRHRYPGVRERAAR